VEALAGSNGAREAGVTALLKALGPRSVVLVGMMGAGKSSVGKRLAQRLGLSFYDADTEIERAAGMSIPEMFEKRGEAEFRQGEQRVIARLLGEGPAVLATGGGAFMDPETRARVRAQGRSVWLKADIDLLARRVGRKDTRPLLRDKDPREVLEALAKVRHPIYAEAED
jgi:shikimate kinase